MNIPAWGRKSFSVYPPPRFLSRKTARTWSFSHPSVPSAHLLFFHKPLFSAIVSAWLKKSLS